MCSLLCHKQVTNNQYFYIYKCTDKYKPGLSPSLWRLFWHSTAHNRRITTHTTTVAHRTTMKRSLHSAHELMMFAWVVFIFLICLSCHKWCCKLTLRIGISFAFNPFNIMLLEIDKFLGDSKKICYSPKIMRTTREAIEGIPCQKHTSDRKWGIHWYKWKPDKTICRCQLCSVL